MKELAFQPLDDHHYNELVQATGIIRASANLGADNMEDGFPIDHAEQYQSILRAADRLAKVIDHIRGYRISQATIDKAIGMRDAGEVGWERLFDEEANSSKPLLNF